jgi:hypothetical protein
MTQAAQLQSIYRGHTLTESADLLGQTLVTAYQPDGSALGQYSNGDKARQAIDRAYPKQLTAQGVLPFNDGAQLGPLFS